MNYALVAAAKVLKQNPAFAGATLSVDGKLIDLAAAESELTKASFTKPSKPHPRIDNIVDKLSVKVQSLQAKLATSKSGRFANKLLQARPEWVNARVVVNVKTADGKSIDIPVRVTDRKKTTFLERLSLGINTLNLVIPLIGFVIPLGAAAVAVVASAAVRASGDKAFADSLRSFAGKHTVLGVLSVPPGFGDAISALAVVNDAVHVSTSARAVTVAELEKLTKS